MDGISIVSRSSDPVDKIEITWKLRFRTLSVEDVWKQRCKSKVWRSSGRIRNVRLQFWESMENQMTSSGTYSRRIYVIADPSKNPDWFARAEHRAWKIHRPDHLHVNVQRHRLERKGNDGTCISNLEKVKEYAKGTLDVPRSWRRKEVVWNSSWNTWRKMGIYSHSKWWNDSKIPVIQYSRVSVLRVVQSCGILKKTNDRDTVHFHADASNSELLFRIIHSVNQLSIYGAVLIWCEQFGLIEEEMVQERPQNSLLPYFSSQFKREEKWSQPMATRSSQSHGCKKRSTETRQIRFYTGPMAERRSIPSFSIGTWLDWRVGQVPRQHLSKSDISHNAPYRQRLRYDNTVRRRFQ